jgi:hypothetical protein
MPTTIPPITIVTIVCAIVAAGLFISGYVRGFRASVEDFDQASDKFRPDTSSRWGILIPLAVAAAGVVIALLGVSPIFIQLAPFLSILSAATIGLLFYIEPSLD